METNAGHDSKFLAKYLVETGKGTFTKLINTKVGKVVGGKNGLRYGDDRVMVYLVTGFPYAEYVRAKKAELASVTDAQVIAAAAAKGVTLDADTVELARAELALSFMESITGTNESTTDHVYETLTVDKVPVKGGRVYKCCKDNPDHVCKCRDCSGDAKAPKDGTIYLSGLFMGQEVLVPAKNGKAPEPNSKPKTIAKDTFESMFKTPRFVQYKLEPGTDFLLQAGDLPALEANEKGFQVPFELMNMLMAA